MSSRQRLSILERAKENAEESVLREREQREKVTAENAELQAQLRDLRVKYGIDELIDHPSASTAPTARGDAENSGDLSTWPALLLDTKALQTSLEDENRSRRDKIATLREAGAMLGPDPESVMQFNAVLDGLMPKRGSGGADVGLAHLVVVEDRLVEMKSHRAALEEHLAHLNRVHADRSATDERNFTATSLMSQRLWKLEEHTAALREVVFQDSELYRGSREGFDPTRSEHSFSMSTDGHGVSDWRGSDSLLNLGSPLSSSAASLLNKFTF